MMTTELSSKNIQAPHYWQNGRCGNCAVLETTKNRDGNCPAYAIPAASRLPVAAPVPQPSPTKYVPHKVSPPSYWVCGKGHRLDEDNCCPICDNPNVNDPPHPSPTLPAREGEIALEDCPVGMFQFGVGIGFKSEYCTQQSNGDFSIDAYVVDSGEYFWGGTNCAEKQRALLVTPIDLLSANREKDETIAQLRGALIESGRAVGCFLADGVSTGFIVAGVPDEVKAKVAALREQVERLKEHLMMANDRRDEITEMLAAAEAKAAPPEPMEGKG